MCVCDYFEQTRTRVVQRVYGVNSAHQDGSKCRAKRYCNAHPLAPAFPLSPCLFFIAIHLFLSLFWLFDMFNKVCLNVLPASPLLLHRFLHTFSVLSPALFHRDVLYNDLSVEYLRLNISLKP